MPGMEAGMEASDHQGRPEWRRFWGLEEVILEANGDPNGFRATLGEMEEAILEESPRNGANEGGDFFF